MSKREYDQNGYLTVKDNPITKAGVFEYLGSEVGLSPDDPLYNSIVKVYRSEEELIKALDTFNVKPIINEHAWLGKNGMPVEKKGVIGATGETSYFEYPYVKNTISIYSQDIQDEIDNGKKDLSAGYSCKYVAALVGEFLPKNGIFNGEQYQYEQVKIGCNHLALVDVGRSGPDVSVLDTKEKINTKDKSMTLEELLKLIAELSPEDKTALIEALKPTTDNKPVEDNEAKKEESKDNGATEKTGDAEVSESEVAEVVDLVEKAEELEAKAMDSLNKRIKVLKVAMKKDKEVKSFDSSKFLKEISERDKLAKGLVPLIGAFDHSAMTLNDVAVYGAKKLDVVCTQDTAVAVVKAVLSVKQKEVKAQDTATVNKTSQNDVKSKLWGVK